MAEQDSPWKEALECYLEPFLALFFPALHADIDWTRDHEWLPQELRKLMRKDEVGKRALDLLVKVWLQSGVERWLLIHLEVQIGHEVDFPRRVFVYHYRLFNRYNRAVCSLAILADARRKWRPRSYQHNIWGCRLRFEFPIVKLLDWLPRLAELETNPNPFAAIVQAHLLAQQTRRDAAGRLAHRLRLVRGLHKRGLSREDIERLFHLIDWFMELPSAEDALFWEEIERDEKENNMPHLTTIEKRGLERGRAEGRAEMLLRALERRFGVAPPKKMATRIRETTDLTLLEQWLDAVFTASSLDDFQQHIQG